MMKKVCIFLGLVLWFGLPGCSQRESTRYEIRGLGEGTTYSIVYFNDRPSVTSREIDSIIAAFDASCSIYNPNSLLTRLNENRTDSVDGNIADCIALARQVSLQGDGLYDITIKPLIDAWKSYSAGESERPDIDSLVRIVGFDKISVQNNRLIKQDPRMQIDLNSIAKGYSVDLIAAYLKRQGITRFVVEVGGEVVASGRREDDALWRIGIDKPKEGNFFPGKFLQDVLLLEDAAMATSGNYRQFYMVEGKERINHIISPKTGENSQNTMLSATVIAPSCAEADAYATLFMVSGIEKAREILSRNPHLGAYLIYADGDEDRAFITPDVAERIKK